MKIANFIKFPLKKERRKLFDGFIRIRTREPGALIVAQNSASVDCTRRSFEVKELTSKQI